jgi:prophage regulatory protein
LSADAGQPGASGSEIGAIMSEAIETIKDEIRPMLSLRQVLALVPFSRTTLYREMDAGRFPRAREIAPRRIAWFKSDVLAWQRRIDSKVA